MSGHTATTLPARAVGPTGKCRSTPSSPTDPRCSSTPATAASARTAYDILAAIAGLAGLDDGIHGDFTPHTLRHQAGTTMVRAGVDIVTVAELLGHSLEVARRYSLPTHADKQRAIAHIPVDE